MRAYLPDYELKAPKKFAEALALLSSHPGIWKPFAGGTDLMVLLEAGKLSHKKFLSLWHFDELRGISQTADQITLGALTTYRDVLDNETLQKEFPLLCQAARETGAIAIQNRGTLGGNIVNASPAADSPPALLVYDTELELVSTGGTRRVPYSTFHQGYKKTAMRPDEVLRAIHIKRNMNGYTQHYRKVGTRKAQAISKVCFAAALKLDQRKVADVRLALGSVAATTVRLLKTEASLKGRVIDAKRIQASALVLAQEITPIDDIRSTSDFRKTVAANLLKDFLSEL